MTPEVRKSFALLEVRPDSTPAEVRTAYHELVKVWHPDRFEEDRLRRRANEKLKQLNRAYRLLQEFQGPDHAQSHGQGQASSSADFWGVTPYPGSFPSEPSATAHFSPDDSGSFMFLGKMGEAYLQNKLSEARFLIGAIESALSRPDSQVEEMLQLTFGPRGEISEVPSEDPEWSRGKCLRLPARFGLRARMMINPGRRFLCIPGNNSHVGGIVEVRVPGGGFTWSMRRNQPAEFLNVPLGGLGPFLYDQLRTDSGGAFRLEPGSPWSSCRERLGRALAAGLEIVGRSVVPLKDAIESVMNKTADDAVRELRRIGRVWQEPERLAGRAIRVIPEVDQLTGEVALDAAGRVMDGAIDYADGDSAIRFQLQASNRSRPLEVHAESNHWSLSQTGKMTSVDQLMERELARHFR